MEDNNIGKTFGIYTINGVHKYRHVDGHLLYECTCNVCQGHIVRKLSDIKTYNKQCTHNAYQWKSQRLYSIFYDMLNRCYNPECKDYKWYGLKGIVVCDEWKQNPENFERWAIQNGYSDDVTIDRISSDKNYSPDNCQWISRSENSRKAGTVNWITVGDYTLTGHQWAEKFSLGTNTINTAIRNYGLDKTIDLITAMLQEHPSTKCRQPCQSWFSVYGIQT